MSLSLRAFLDERAEQIGYSTSTEFVHDLLSVQQERAELRAHFLSAIESGFVATTIDELVAELREVENEAARTAGITPSESR